jgi:hypothetical protein
MTQLEAVERAMRAVDQIWADANRKLVTDLVVAGMDDDKIEMARVQARDWQASERPEIVAQVTAVVARAAWELNATTSSETRG